MQDLFIQLTNEYESNILESRKFFDKWIEQGEEVYKEKELLHTGAAYAFLRMRDKILIDYEHVDFIKSK